MTAATLSVNNSETRLSPQRVTRVGPPTASPGERLEAIARIIARGEIGHATHYLTFFGFDVPRLTREDRTALAAISAKLAAGRDTDAVVSALHHLAASLDSRPEMQLPPEVSPGDPVLLASRYESRARDAARDANFERRAGREHSAVIYDLMAADDLARAREILEATARSEDDDAA